MSWLALTTARSAEPAEVGLEAPDALVRRRASSRRGRVGSWSSTWLQWTVTLSPGFQLRTAGADAQRPRPAASEPSTWYGRAWRAPHADSLPSRVEEGEGRERLEDRGPHRVEVDGRRHDRDVRPRRGRARVWRPRRRGGSCGGPCPPTPRPRTSSARRGTRTPPGRTRGSGGSRARRRTRRPGSHRGTPAWPLTPATKHRPVPSKRPAGNLAAPGGDPHARGRPRRLHRGLVNMPGSVILAGARTPIGSASGAPPASRPPSSAASGHQGRAREGRDRFPRTSTTSSWARSCRPAPARSPPARLRCTPASR